ncbi:MAG: hypothetical protein ABI910_21665 [Gemmatimonadota bacterium]
MADYASESRAPTLLFRAVGRAELALIEASDFRTFPPRMPEQPIFYPVLQESYAAQIARDWNPKDEASGYAGYVTRFHVRSDFLTAYEVRIVGSAQHLQYWIPAADLAAFNAAIVGCIEVVADFLGVAPRWEWRELNRAVEEVLYEVWDPLDVREATPADEYNDYAPAITRLLFRHADDAEITDALATEETGAMGLTPPTTERLTPVLAALRAAAERVARHAP